MPRYRIPLTGTSINWPPAAAGRYRINGILRIAGSARTIPIELSFKREPLRRAFRRAEYWCYVASLERRVEENNAPLTDEEQRQLQLALPQYIGSTDQLPPDRLLAAWGDSIMRTLYDHAKALTDGTFTKFLTMPPRPSRKRLQVLEGCFQEIEYWLRIDRSDLRTLAAFLSSKSDSVPLAHQVRWALLPTILIDWALRGHPRGPDAQDRHELWVVIRAAVFVARELIVAVKKPENARLKASLFKVINADRFASLLLRDEEQPDLAQAAAQRRLVMVLADRALRPAVDRFRIRLLERDISSVLEPGSTRELADMFRAVPEWLSEWFELLLSPHAGQAARVLKLI